MYNNGYDPETLVHNYRRIAHGKARAGAIRSAINQADLNNDIPYMMFFREELCDESYWFVDELEVVTVYPELLAIMDRYPETRPVKFAGDRDNILNILNTYKDLLDVCTSFYQIPMEDCINFHNDFMKRWLAYGRTAREAYHMFFDLYLETGDLDNAAKFLDKLKKVPAEAYDCVACAITGEIKYYLLNNEKDKADKLAEKVYDGTYRCNSRWSDSILKLRRSYLKYYILHGDYEKAAEITYLMEHSGSQINAYNKYASFMCAYVHIKPGRGLRIYKKHWKEWQEENNQYDRYYNFKDAACFFKGLETERSRNTVRLELDRRFPLYNEENIYNIKSMSKYYYKEAEDIARKFDKRNTTDRFIKELEMSFANV